MHCKAALLALWAVPALAGQGGSHMSAPNLADYCFYSIYSSLASYTFVGSATISSGSSGSSNSSSTSHGSSSHGSSVASTSHGSRMVRRGHKGGSTTTGFCQAPVEVMSLYASAKAYCNKKALAGLQSYWEYLCEQDSLTLMDLSSAEANATDAYIASLPIIDPSVNDTTLTGTIESPVLLSRSYFNRAYKSYVTHDYALAKDKRFGWGIMGYWGGVLVIGIILRGWNFLVNRRRGSRWDAENGTAQSKPWGPLGAVFHFLRTYIIIPASFAPGLSHHQQLWFWHTIPKRIDSLIVFGFWAVTIILSCVDYQSFSGNISTPDLAQQNWQYSSDRTGVLSYACLPFLWLFSGRNNIFLWATDFSVQSFNIFHRHVAWACTLLAIVHSIAYTVVFILYDGRFQSAWKQNYWYMGVVATIAMSFMLVQSTTMLRRKFYESFLIIHIVLAILTIYALFRHTSFDGTTYNGYLWQMVAIWGFDRTVRLVRIAYCNIHIRLGQQFIATTRSTVGYNEESDLVKIEIRPASKTLTPGAGQHYYLYQPFTLKGWENHPFTLGAYTSVKTEAVSEHNLIFYIRPYDGWTRRLRDQCRKKNGQTHPTLLLEGPYGHQAPLHTFDTVLMIVGGTGIASAVPYIQDHISRVTKGTTKTTNVYLVWSSRQKEMFTDVFSDDISGVLQHGHVNTTFFCTTANAQAPTSDSDSSSTPEAPDNSEKVGPMVNSVPDPDVQICSGRLNVRATVSAAVAEAQASSTSLAVMTCGPARMADECREAVYDAMSGGFRDIQYFEEAFGW